MTTTTERAQTRSDTPDVYPTGVAPDALQSASTALRAAHRARCARTVAPAGVPCGAGHRLT